MLILRLLLVSWILFTFRASYLFSSLLLFIIFYTIFAVLQVYSEVVSYITMMSGRDYCIHVYDLPYCINFSHIHCIALNERIINLCFSCLPTWQIQSIFRILLSKILSSVDVLNLYTSSCILEQKYCTNAIRFDNFWNQQIIHNTSKNIKIKFYFLQYLRSGEILCLDTWKHHTSLFL